ncbi:outer dynein arm-docking complex subunit 1-like [Culicoides brevitarsis]|uniref:outer dynein arm-docking complex subunit 1-like n=1 Tax=Culicoides brevitarsis TaxID=469753 RepID=UPI00307C75F2
MFLEVEPEPEDQPLAITAAKDRQNEQELSKLQRAFRHQARGLPTNNFKESAILTRDIRTFTAETAALDTVLDHVLCRQHVATYEGHVKYLQDHIECQRDLDEQIKLNKIFVEQLNSQLRRLDALELELRRNSMTDFERSQKIQKAKKDYDTFDQRLFVSRQREGILAKENRELQDYIRHMLVERENFHQNWDRLVQELGQNKRYLIDLIERSVLAFTRDEDWFAKIDGLEQRALISQNVHVSEILQLFRKLDADQIYQDYLGVKGFRREMMPLDEREVRRREYVETCLKEKLHQFWKIINKIKERYGVKNKSTENTDDSPKSTEEKLLLLWKIIDQQKISKDGYFAHFKYLNEVYNSIELLNGRIVDKQKRISAVRDIQNNNKNAFTENYLSIFNELQKQKERTTEQQNAWKTSETQLLNYLSIIHDMFKLLNCDTSFIESLLGDKKSVTNFNIKLFLSTLEATMNKILAYIYYCETKSKVPASRRTVRTQQRAASRKIIAIHETVNTTQCSECAEREDVNRYDETIVLPSAAATVKERVKQRVKANELEYRLHNLSKCRLPKSRILVNKRFM